MFDRCVCLNLLRRPDRWQRFFENLAAVDWPFGAPCQRVAALDAKVVVPPAWWKLTAGAWANLQTHLHVCDQAVADGAKTLLVLEDDALLSDDIYDRARAFMAAVPDDWEQVYFGGSHFTKTGLLPSIVNSEVLKAKCVNGAWGYAVRGRGLVILSAVCKRPDCATLQDDTPFVDAIWATLHRDGIVKAYTPHRWMIGHAGGRSDVFETDREDEWYHLPDETLAKLEAA